MRPCKAHGCGFFAKGFSTYCEYHKRNQSRHGHPLQKGITKADLKPYIQEVRTFLRDNHPDKAPAVLQDVWARTVKQAQRFQELADRGRPIIGHEMEANQAILSLSREQGAETIAVTLMAMGIWYQEDPLFWKYDEGFRFQVVRMLLRLNPREATYQWHNGKMKRTAYRQTPPRVTQYLWSIIHSTGLIAYGVDIAKHKEKAKAALLEKQRQERAAFFGTTHQAQIAR